MKAFSGDDQLLRRIKVITGLSNEGTLSMMVHECTRKAKYSFSILITCILINGVLALVKTLAYTISSISFILLHASFGFY